MQEMLFEGRRDGGFPASGEAGEPESASLLAAESAALGVRQGGMPCYISLGWSVEHDRRNKNVSAEEGAEVEAHLRCCHFDGRKCGEEGALGGVVGERKATMP